MNEIVAPAALLAAAGLPMLGPRGQPLHLPAGLIGFPERSDYLLRHGGAGRRFFRLECAEGARPNFHLYAVAGGDPPPAPDQIARAVGRLGWADGPLFLFLLVTQRAGRAPAVTVNALAPLVADLDRGLAVQLALDGPVGQIRRRLR